MILFPLTADQLQMLVSDLSEFEKTLSYQYDGESLNGEMYSVFKGQINPIRESQVALIWLSFWMIVLKDSKTIIGSIGFKGIPTNSGRVEIGYGINSIYERRGYATEAAKAMISFALEQPDVSEVVAEVDKDNISSQRVLQKNSLEKYTSVENFDWYIIAK